VNLAYLPVVALVGGLGAIARYFVVRTVSRAASDWTTPAGTPVPARALGTATVNVAGAAAAGVLLALAGPVATMPWAAILGGGFLSAFTTFSAWMLEVVGLWRSGRPAAALLHLLGTLVAGVLVAALAYRLAAPS
jgi:CrcB protein